LAAAGILAGVAAWTTNKRLTKQIKDSGQRQERELMADAERQQRELDARTEGQMRQLAHARELADLADLRTLLDEAAVALNEAGEARIEVTVSFTEHGVTMPAAAKDKLKDCGRALYPLLVRLHVRLGEQNAIARSFSDATAAVLSTWWQVSSFEDDDAVTLKEKREQVRADLKTFTAASLAFTKSAVERAGTVPSRGGDTALRGP
jgi:hypothetical protein